MHLIALAVFTLIGLCLLPRITLTVLAFVLNPLLGCVVGTLALISLVWAA